MRDRDEWRRPWPEGSAGAAALPTPGETLWTPTVTTTSTTSSAAPAPYEVGLEGAFDVVADAPGAAYASAQSSTGPAVSVAPGHDASSRRSARRERRRGGFLGGVAGGVLGTVLTVALLVPLGVVELGEVLGGGATTETPVALAPVPTAPVERVPLPDPGAGASVIPDVADRVLPSVVRINVRGTVDMTGTGALGSGVVYRADGYIITNEHVIAGSSAVEVLLSNGDRYAAEVVGTDALNDLAVLRIDAQDLVPIDLRPADAPVRVGETVVAIGSPFGLDATVTSGIISALNRDLRLQNTAEVIPAVIQTDAAINPGNSGGALVDLQGRLVGINTAIMSRSGQNEGVGFAVPVRQAIVSSDQLIEQGFVRYPLLGITGTDISAEVQEAFGLNNRRGAVVDTVQDGSGAAAGGMRAGDVIVAVDGLALRSMSDLVAEVRRRAPGMTVVFEVLRRDGTGQVQRVTIEAVLGERPRS